MALYIVLHHPKDPDQPWANAWAPGSDDAIEAITTTERIAKAAKSEGRVFVHRCAYGADAAAVVCEARVKTVAQIDRRSWYVVLETTRRTRNEPPMAPGRGTNSYEAEEP